MYGPYANTRSSVSSNLKAPHQREISFLSDKRPSLKTLDFLFCIPTLHQPFYISIISQHCLPSTGLLHYSNLTNLVYLLKNSFYTK